MPRLSKAKLSIGAANPSVDAADLAYVVGDPELKNIQRAVAVSRRVIIVLTPDWLASELNEFLAMLARYADPIARERKLLPLLLKPCELPSEITSLRLTFADFTNEKNWEREFKRLARDIEDTLPIPLPWTQPREDRARLWRAWLRRYRWTLGLGVIAIGLAILGILMVLQRPPYEPRPGWAKLSLNAVGAWRLARVGEVLLVATRTISGCNTRDSGLQRSIDHGMSWSPVPVPLQIPSNGGCQLAAITRFAAAPNAPRSIYAATTNVGLLKGDPTGAKWDKIMTDELPLDLFSVAVLPGDPETVFVTGQTEGVFRRIGDNGKWTRLDGNKTCNEHGEWKDLPGAAARKAHVTTSSGLVYVASPQVNFNPPAILAGSGIYVSEDGGNCWRLIHDADGRWMYTTLAAVPAVPDEVFFGAIERDQWSPLNPPHQIVGQINRQTKGLIILWDKKNVGYGVLLNLLVEPHGKYWYLSNALGQVIRGQTSQTDSDFFGNGLGLVACRFQRPCFSDLANDFDVDAPLLLADESVYRWSTVPWLQAMFP